MVKKFLKLFIFLSLAFLLALNWKNIYWIFNYRAMSALTYGFFNPYPESRVLAQSNDRKNPIEQLPPLNPLDISLVPQGSEPRQATSDKQQATTQNNGQITTQTNVLPEIEADALSRNSSENNFLEIPKIGISAPVIISESDNAGVLKKNLDTGVVYYPQSVLPGQVGRTLLLGHSAPENWPHIKYDWVFNDLNDLSPGDEITLDFGNKRYTYKVKRGDIIGKGAEIISDPSDQKSNTLILISCWPPGKDYKRIVVQAQLIK
ncbi:MAG: class E sortase [Patescibacteria group bacterium]